MLVGIIIVLVLVLVLKSNGGDSTASPSPTVQTSAPTTAPTPTATHTRKPKPSPTTTSPTPPPSPQPSQAEALRAAVEKKANKDRPNEVKHVGNAQFYRSSDCPSKQAGQANVRFTVAEKAGFYIFCLDGSKWVYSQGPTYGE